MRGARGDLLLYSKAALRPVVVMGGEGGSWASLPAGGEGGGGPGLAGCGTQLARPAAAAEPACCASQKCVEDTCSTARISDLEEPFSDQATVRHG